MRVKKTKPKAIVDGLMQAVEFLNAIGAETTDEQWRAFLEAILKKNRPFGPFNSLATNILTGGGRDVPTLRLEEAKQLRWWMNNDLGFVRAKKPVAKPFEGLVYRLNKLKQEMRWQCDAAPESFKRFNPSQAIVKIRWADGTVGRWATISWPMIKTPEDYFYSILGKALETGDVTRLKICRECGKFFVAVKDRKRGFCEGTTCKDDFHNRQKGRDDYYKNRRQKERKKAHKAASKLLVAGRAEKIHHRTLFERIKEKTKLPAREIEKIFARESLI